MFSLARSKRRVSSRGENDELSPRAKALLEALTKFPLLNNPENYSPADFYSHEKKDIHPSQEVQQMQREAKGFLDSLYAMRNMAETSFDKAHSDPSFAAKLKELGKKAFSANPKSYQCYVYAKAMRDLIVGKMVQDGAAAIANHASNLTVLGIDTTRGAINDYAHVVGGSVGAAWNAAKKYVHEAAANALKKKGADLLKNFFGAKPTAGSTADPHAGESYAAYLKDQQYYKGQAQQFADEQARLKAQEDKFRADQEASFHWGEGLYGGKVDVNILPTSSPGQTQPPIQYPNNGRPDLISGIGEFGETCHALDRMHQTCVDSCGRQQNEIQANYGGGYRWYANPSTPNYGRPCEPVVDYADANQAWQSVDNQGRYDYAKEDAAWSDFDKSGVYDYAKENAEWNSEEVKCPEGKYFYGMRNGKIICKNLPGYKKAQRRKRHVSGLGEWRNKHVVKTPENYEGCSSDDVFFGGLGVTLAVGPVNPDGTLDAARMDALKPSTGTSYIPQPTKTQAPKEIPEWMKYTAIAGAVLFAFSLAK